MQTVTKLELEDKSFLIQNWAGSIVLWGSNEFFQGSDLPASQIEAT
jgi:hypothetical protein